MKPDEKPHTAPERYRNFRVRRIDSIHEIDLDTVTAEDLIWQYGTGVDVTRGEGRYKTHSYCNGVQTDIGDLELSVWIAAAEYVVKRDGLEEEAAHLQEFITRKTSRYGFAWRNPRMHALEHCIRSTCKNPAWASFIPYNQKYHPEVLASARLVRIITECCQKPGEVTEEQIAQSFDGRVCCPICGRFSAYRRAPQEEERT
ncbi:MAG: hypothetical protein HFF83_13220 [Oscillibacter sp.]|jgi:hypothetical protein|nr:hypothetical protein [Oscillibacter sp.]